jgi:hypothetical protein
MSADQSQLLSQLQDIHGSTYPGWWPPAPGWWLLALTLAVVLVWALRAVVRKLSEFKRRRELIKALESLQQQFAPGREAHQYLAGLNSLFRVVALKAFPGTGCARLQGEEWVRFIQSRMPHSAGTASLSCLARGPYEPLPEFDAQALSQQARIWVRRHG